MRTFTRLLIAAATVTAGLSTATTAHAGEALDAELSATPSSVQPGEDVTLTGAGWDCGAPALTLDTDPVTDLPAVTPDQTGAFELTIAAPTTPDTYTVTAEDDCQRSETATFTVLAPATTTTTTTTTTTVAPTTTAAPTTTTLAPTTTAAATTTTTTPAVGPVLPETGSSDGRLAAFALVALLGGVGLVAATRRQRTS